MSDQSSKKCPECSETIQLDAKKCKHCQADLRNLLMRHKILAGMFGGVLVMGIVSAAGSPAQSTDTVTSEPEEVISVSSSELVSAYKQNEIAADSKYKDKLLDVKGTVDSIGESFGQQYVTLKSSDFLIHVQCFLASSESEKAGTLTQGQSVTLQGRDDGMSMNISLKNCVIK